MSDPDVLVVGAGPAGLSAAIEAAARGARVLLVDEGARAGGQIFRRPPAGFSGAATGTSAEAARKARLLARFAAAGDRITHLAETSVTAVYPGLEVLIADETTSRIVRPRALVVAPGLGEYVPPFPGWTLPGVTTVGALQALLKNDAVRAGDRIALAGTGPLVIAVAADLVRAGRAPVAVALLNSPWSLLARPRALWDGREAILDGLAHLAVLKRAGVALSVGWVPVAAEGDTEVARFTIARHHGDGRPSPTERRSFDVDAVGVSFGLVSDTALARAAGVPHRFEPRRGGWIPERGADGSTAVPGLFVAGDGAGIGGAFAAEADGLVAGAAAAAHAGCGEASHGTAAARARRDRFHRFQAALAPQYDLPEGVWSWAAADTIVCRCENVRRDRIDRAIADDHVTLDGIKRNSRAGMGLCGGRTCQRTLAALAGHDAADTAPVAARPGIRPVTLAALAARVEED